MCLAKLKHYKRCLLEACKYWRYYSNHEFDRHYRRQRLLKKSWLPNCLICFFFFWIYRFTLDWNLRVIIRSKYIRWWYNNKYKIIEWYVVGWSILITLLFLLLWPFSNNWFIWLFILFGACRLIDLFQAWVTVNILNTDPRPHSAPRMFVLNIIGFSQIIIIYAGYAFLASKSFFSTTSSETIESIWNGLYYSFTTITTINSGFSPNGFLGHFLFYTEVLFGILFLVVVIQQALWFYHQRPKHV